MNSSPKNILPLGDFKTADQWQTHVNSIFYGILGPEIHNHFQTFVSLDYRLAHALADEYFAQAQNREADGKTRFILEWGVGNGNLAGCFLTRLRELDTENRVYPHTHYILCDFSEEILQGARANPRLNQHSGRFSTVRVAVDRLDCLKPRSVDKIISNEIWDDLATRVLVKNQNTLYEEYLQPCLDPNSLNGEIESLQKMFIEKDLGRLREYPSFLAEIVWERSYQRVDIADWPRSELIRAQVDRLADDIPVPINIGAFSTLEHAHDLLSPDSLGYTSFDYGMYSIEELNREGRPYFNLYGGQYTFMVNFELLADVGRAVGFKNVQKEYQDRFVGRHLKENVRSIVDLLQSHPAIAEMPPWDRDLLMIQTLNALNETYKSPYKNKMDYPLMQGTPKKQRKQIAKLVKSLNSHGVPDTVAYVTEGEVFSVIKQLKRLGYGEKVLERAFQTRTDPIAFVGINFR